MKTRGCYGVWKIPINEADGTCNEGPGESGVGNRVWVHEREGNNRMHGSLWIVRQRENVRTKQQPIGPTVSLWTWRKHLTECPER